jgi:GNAT superfamily N-acetyltransferase
MISFRPAHETELSQIYEVFYHNEVRESPQPPAPGDPPAYLRHVLQTGTLFVASQDGAILAYAGAITRGGMTFLTDLFVHPAHQSGQLGKTLLRAVLPQDDLIHCTVSSSDPRALALYIRAGMRPQWPYFALQLEKPIQEWPATHSVEISEADSNDQELIDWDSQISGRQRPLEHDFWVREQQAVPLWFRRGDQMVGYGYIRLKAGTLWHPRTCALGPIGVKAAEDAPACTLAAVYWALQRADVLSIEVPGPHPCLTPLLERGFRISYVDTFVSTTDMPKFFARCYIPSGGDLF